MRLLDGFINVKVMLYAYPAVIIMEYSTEMGMLIYLKVKQLEESTIELD